MQAPPHTQGEIDRLLARLEQKMAELDRLHHDIAQDAHALAHAASASSPGGGSAASMFSVREAAAELGVSVSMLHKLLKERRLGHLKIGSRTLVTAEHLARFREAAQAETATRPGAAGAP